MTSEIIEQVTGPSFGAAGRYIFIPKQPNLKISLGGLGIKNVGSFMAIWNILQPFGIF
jgi:hypothetical protein